MITLLSNSINLTKQWIELKDQLFYFGVVDFIWELIGH